MDKGCSGCVHPQSWHSRDGDGECSHCSCLWQEPMVSYPMMDEPDGGVVCMDCNRPFKFGDPYKQRLDSVDEDGEATVDVICVYC